MLILSEMFDSLEADDGIEHVLADYRNRLSHPVAECQVRSVIRRMCMGDGFDIRVDASHMGSGPCEQRAAISLSTGNIEDSLANDEGRYPEIAMPML